jgi:hypothetical protein
MAAKTKALVLFVLISIAFMHTAEAQGGVWSDVMPCVSGEYRPCGINVGECRRGVRVCEDGQWSECRGGAGPSEEICGNGKDEDCNGVVDDCIDDTPAFLCIGAGVAILIFALIFSKIKVHEKEDF